MPLAPRTLAPRTLALRTLVAGTAAAATLIALAACSPPAEESGPTSLTIGIDPTTYSLIASPLDGQTLLYFAGRASYDSLLGWDPVEAEFTPWLAEEYEISEDRKTVTLKLREDVDFIDGEHMDAQAVADFFALALASDAYRGNGIAQHHGLEVAATGEYTVEMTVTEPVGEKFMVDILRDTGIASPVAAQDREQLLLEPAGTGPYLVDEIVPDVSISYVRNPDYWNTEAYDFDTLTYIVFEDRIAASNALKSGQIDATPIDSNLAADIESEGFTIHTGGSGYVSALTLDFTGEVVPALGDPRVRQAINMAFDRASVLETIELGYGTISNQPFAQGQAEYIEGADDVYPYDLERARELMAEAGYADGFDLVIPGASNVSFYPANYEPLVQQSLADIGIRVEYEQFADTGALLAALATGDYGVILARFSYENTLGVIVGETPLFGHFADDPTFTELNSIIAGGTAEEGSEASAELGQYMLDQAWYAPIVHPSTLWATTADVDLTLSNGVGSLGLHRFTIAE